VEPRNTLNIRKSVRQKPRLLFRVFRVFRGKNPIPAIQEATDCGTTEHTEHTEIRTSETSAAFSCVPCIPWSRIRSQRFKKQPIVEPRNTPNTRKSGRQKPRLLFCVFCVFRGKKSDPSDSRSNRLWKHRTH
jgi:hypothetical protein